MQENVKGPAAGRWRFARASSPCSPGKSRDDAPHRSRVIESIDEKKKIKDYESIDEDQEKKNSLEIETEVDLENKKENNGKKKINISIIIIFIILTLIFIGFIAYYAIIKINENKKESQLDPKDEVLHLNQQPKNNDTSIQANENNSTKETPQNSQTAENNSPNESPQNVQTENNKISPNTQITENNNQNETAQNAPTTENNYQNETPQNPKTSENNSTNQTNENAQTTENISTNQTVQNAQQTQNNVTNQTVQSIQTIQINQTNHTVQKGKLIKINGTNKTLNISLKHNKSRTVNKKIIKPKIPFYDFLPKTKRPIKTIKDVFYSNRLYLNSKELTIEYIDFIRPLDNTKESMYNQILFPNLSFDNYKENHTYNYSYLLLKLRNQQKISSSKSGNKTLSNKTNSTGIINKNISAGSNSSSGLNNLSNTTLNNSVSTNTNSSLVNVSNSNNLALTNNNTNCSLANVSNSNNLALTNNNTNSSLANASNSNNLALTNNNTNSSLVNASNSNNLTIINNNATSNGSHSLRNMRELDSTILKDFYTLCNQKRLNIVKRNKKEHFDKPVISIIIPYFNSRLNLIKTLRSVQLQTLKNIEIIIVDDNIIRVNKDYKNLLDSDYRFRLFSQPRNLGLWRKRIDGFLYSRGKYILHINPGDILADSYVLDDLYHLVTKYSLDTVRFTFSKTKYNRNTFNQNIQFNDKKIYPSRFTRITYGRPYYDVHVFGYGTIWNRLVRASVMRKGLDLLNKNLLNVHKDLWEDMWWNDLIDRVSYSNLVVNRLGYMFLYDKKNIFEPRIGNKFLRNKTIKEFILFWYWDYYLLPRNDNKKSIVNTLRKYARPENKFCQLPMSLTFLTDKFRPYENLLKKLIEDPFVDAEDKLFASQLYNSTISSNTSKI